MRFISKWFLTGLLLLGLPSSRDPKSPRQQNSGIETNDRANYETELFNLINITRTTPVITNTLLMQAAQAHSKDMADHNYLAHGNLNGDHAGARLTQAGYPFYYWGEIIAGGSVTPTVAIEGWLNSPEHKKVLLEPSFTHIGLGYTYKENTTFHHYWTVILAVPR